MGVCKLYNWYHNVMCMTFEGETIDYHYSKVKLSEFLISTVMAAMLIIVFSSWIIPLRIAIPKIKNQLSKFDVEFTCKKE